MPGNKGKQRRWGADKHPIFFVFKEDILDGIKEALEIFKMGILEMWCVSMCQGMYISFLRVKRGK